jgi:AcrR family transcriptional regulator
MTATGLRTAGTQARPVVGAPGRQIGVESEVAAGTAGRRERKKTATRAAIRDAAMRLALRDGVERVTLEQIAAEADIALRTFFNYFSSKEEAVVAGAAGDFRAFVAEFRDRPRTESVLQALLEAALVVLDRAATDGSDHIAALQVIRGERSLVPQLLAALAAQEAVLAEAIAERVGSHGDEGYPRLCAATALAGLRVTLDRWLETAGTDGVPSLQGLRGELERTIVELTAGLDRPSASG